MRHFKRIVALMLAVLLMAGLCACGDKGGESGKPATSANGTKMPEKVKLEHVYTAKYIDSGLPEGSSYNSINFLNDTIYVTVPYNRNVEVDGENVMEMGTVLYSMDPDGNNTVKLAEFPTTMDFNTSEMHMVNISNIVPAPDGTIWYYKTDSYNNWEDENEFITEDKSAIVNASVDGEELLSIPVASLTEDSYFMVNSMFVDKDGDITLTTGTGIIVLDPTGKVLSRVTLEDNFINSLVTTGNGDIVGINNSFDMTPMGAGMDPMAGGGNTTSLIKLDKLTGEFEDIGALPLATTYSIIGGEGDNVLINSGASVYFYDIKTKVLTEKLNWLNSDINYNRVGMIVPASEGRVIVVESNTAGGMFGGMGMGMGMGGASGRLMMLTGKSDSEITEKYLINFAATNLSESLQDAVISFNKTHDEYRIQFKDYSVYNNENDFGNQGGVSQLNYDIIAGDIPDMFLLDGLPFETYASKGLLADLGPIMDADPSFNKEDYLTNVLDACSYKGKICSVIPGFSLMTLVGKSSNVGPKPGWTMEDLSALMQKYPDAAVISDMTKTFMLMMFSMMGLENYIDTDTGSCSFNSQSFIDLLKFLNTFPDEIDYGAMMNGGGGGMGGFGFSNTRYRDNETLMQMAFLSDYESIKTLMYDFGEDITFVGFPVAEGVGSTIQPQLEIGISSKTALTDACWEFIKFLLGDDFQNGIINSESFMAMSAFPVKRSVLDKLAQQAMTEQEDNNGGFGGGFGGMMGMMGSDEQREFMAKPLTQQQVDQVNEAIFSTTNVSRNRDDVLAIIEEEAGAYFAGQKSAETVAGVIQSRVQIYVNENR